MARVLFAWELGGDYGHLSRLLPLALALAERGHEPVFAARDLLGAEAVLAPHGLRWFQAPLWIGRVTNLPPPVSYAELLMAFGFLNPRALTGICRAWRNLVEQLAPALIITDHAPTALLATRGLGIPRLNFGDGFCIPPATQPAPPFRWWDRAQNTARLADSDAQAWKHANEVLFALGAPPLMGLADLHRCEGTLLCTFAELDHYADRPAGQASHAGPIFTLGQGVPVVWPEGDGPRVFAYLKPGSASTDKALAALRDCGARVLAHVPGAARRTLATHASARLVFSEQPLDMEQARASCDLAVCHGGAGTTAAMLLAGKPLLLIPMQMEQTMTARRAEMLGAAVVVTDEHAGQMPRFLARAIKEPGLRDAARRFAERHAGYDQHATVRQARQQCEALMAGVSL
jgi:hypothetical protein